MNQIQTGGKFIAKGQYGCVYKPALKCKGDKKREKDTITKVMLKEEAIKELNNVKIIDNIDSDFKFHLPTPRMCEPKKLSEKHDNMLQDCDFIHKIIQQNPENWKDKVRLLQYKDGGISIKSFMDKHRGNVDDINVNHFMKQLKTLFLGIKEMYENGFVHGDINYNNIVINPNTFQVNYIDFGLSFKVEDFVPKRSFPSFGHHVRPLDVGFLENYPLRKIEVYHNNKYTRFNGRTYELLLNKEFDKIDAVLKSICANDYSSINLKNSLILKDAKLYRSIKHLYEGLERGDPHIYLDDVSLGSGYYEDYYNVYDTLFNRDFTKFSHFIMSHIDVYSLGLFLTYVWEFLTGQKYTFRKSRMLNEAESKFHDLIRNMTRANITKRMNASEAYEEYKNILKIVKRKEKRKTKRREKSKDKTKTQRREKSLEDKHAITYGFSLEGRKDIYKDCPENKIYNVISKRCISKNHSNAKVIKALELHKNIRSEKVKEALSDLKDCPPGKIRNLVSDNCVNKNNAIGRRIINLGLAPRKQLTKRDHKRLMRRATRKNRPLFKPCPENKMYNPISEKCIQRNSTIGKRLQKVGLDGKVDHDAISKHLRKASKCNDKQVYNVVSNRCVSKDGDIGKRIKAINIYKTEI